MENRLNQPLRLPDGRVVVDGQIVHQPLPPIVREIRPVFPPLRVLAVAIGVILYG